MSVRILTCADTSQRAGQVRVQPILPSEGALPALDPRRGRPLTYRPYDGTQQ